jgi:hypothetical protein
MAAFARSGNGGVIVPPGGTGARRKLIISLAARYKLPSVYPYRYYTVDGGLISYGPNPHVCRSHPQGREASRSAGAGADQVRTGYQSQDRKGARSAHSAVANRHRPKGKSFENGTPKSGGPRGPDPHGPPDWLLRGMILLLATAARCQARSGRPWLRATPLTTRSRVLIWFGRLIPHGNDDAWRGSVGGFLSYRRDHAKEQSEMPQVYQFLQRPYAIRYVCRHGWRNALGLVQRNEIRPHARHRGLTASQFNYPKPDRLSRPETHARENRL